MMGLLVFILFAGYIVADRKKILMELKRLWERIK